MKNFAPFQTASVITAFFSLPAAQAVTLAATNFDDTVKSAGSQTMTGIDWSGETLGQLTPSTSVTTVASNNAGYFTTGFGATGFAPDQNIENEGPWTATFELTLSHTASATLTSISFDYAALNNGGGSQGANFRPQNFDITVNGVAFDSQKETTAVNGDLTFTDSVAFSTGLNLVEITSSEVNGPGYNMGIDNLSFEGDVTVIPEPTVSGLVGLGLFVLARRKRVINLR